MLPPRTRHREAVRPRFLAVVWVLALASVLASPTVLIAGDLVFSIPLDDLKVWAEKIVVPMEVTIHGHSAVHSLNSDCEMHFGAESANYKGDPPGLVLEPMNLCVEPFFGQDEESDADWTDFGDEAVDKTVQAEGVPRIWPEHIGGQAPTPSNPHHAIELHPLIRLTVDGQARDFSSFISDAPGYTGGLQPASALRILAKTKVSVAQSDDGMVKVTFNYSGPGHIGNFTLLHVKIINSSVTSADGGHRMNGSVKGSNGAAITVRLVSVAGSHFDDSLADLLQSNGTSAELDALALLALSPEALYKSAKLSHGNSVPVSHPIQLIIYGEETGEQQ